MKLYAMYLLLLSPSMKRSIKTIKVILVLLLLTITLAFGQEDSATIVIIPSQEASIFIDGIEIGTTTAGSAFRTETTAGEHYIEARTVINGSPQSKGEILLLEVGKQKIIKMDFEVLETPMDIISVGNINFDIPGTLTTIAWQTDNPGQEYPYPSYFCAFEKGDVMVLDVTMSNAKGTNLINISTYPDGDVKYTNNAFMALRDLRIKVPERSIYQFTIATNHAFNRNGYLRLGRLPASKETAHFDPTVSYKRILHAETIHEPQDFFINSGSNATFQGGKSRVVLPVDLPENTVEWFYRFSAFREREDLDNVQENFGLFAELTNLLLDLSGTGAAINTLAVELLTQPPGADLCDIFLISPEFRNAFEAKDSEWSYLVDASRKNFKSGNVKVTCCTSGQYYLGLRNPNNFNGVNVTIEVVAITATDDYVMADVE